MTNLSSAAIAIGLMAALTAAPTVHATRGVVRFVDASRLAIARSPRRGREITFVLNQSTERSGKVRVGATVDVRYRIEADRRIATAVAVETAR